MKASSLAAGGGFAGFLATVVIAVLAHFKINVSPEDATIVGSAALAAGAGIAHGVAQYGVKGLVSRFWRGTPSA